MVVPRIVTGSGVMLGMIRSGSAQTRTDLVTRLGWSRVTVSKRLDELLDANLIVTTGQRDSTGGRRAEVFELNRNAGLLLSADIGGSHSRVGVSDLSSNILVEAEVDIDIATGLDRVLTWAHEVYGHLLRTLERKASEVVGIGVGVPGPVDPGTGRLMNPPIMPGWDGVLVADYFRERYPDAVVAVDRDVNIMALGEQRFAWPEVDTFALVKLGLGVGSALILSGNAAHGELGAAGDLGHIRHGGSELCRCGSRGCLEATASGWAIRRELKSLGYSVNTSRDIVALAREGNEDALRLLADMCTQVGHSIADIVGLYNPGVVAIGGNLATLGDLVLNPLKAAVMERIPSYLIDRFVLAPSRLDRRAGTMGASILAQDAVLDPDRVSRITRILV
ncbi:ROK family protein [Lysinibacter sp. HNR]|uniref:ROK family protein n=1 Tax=Lysinibacter sp. HNR TaxID=3031408 RepID=UPI0024351F9B|nr:ROK family protein [Lysinibacter sp. HNR]WGD36498.1 ROK family protein [Lysinibacter sp. HNR]